jgi:hypothetical protein
VADSDGLENRFASNGNGGSNPSSSVKSFDDSKCQEVPKLPIYNGLSLTYTPSQLSGEDPSIVSADDSRYTGDEPSNNKPDHKPDNKLEFADPELMTVLEAWHELPAPVKAGIVAMVKAAQSCKE